MAELLCCSGPETYSVIAILVKPLRAQNVDYQVIIASQYLPNAIRGYVSAQRHQKSWESVADYVTTLRWSAGNCGLGGEGFPLTELLHDRLVFEIADGVVHHRQLAEK
ncbi:hypothetical protein HPB49_005058 [Dermacentor silvarum]|uniref:Uncharacterized protein n=1 Tax=Dermacentor silvarum TaxID=543639 RepID=A0ACB8C267_DERSI|nr:hypothetical protein HPB49_005058 [Dermacentor silvarum]